MAVHYANLASGLLCAPEEATFIRITPSGLPHWGEVLYGAGADLLTSAILGNKIIVHDQEEGAQASERSIDWLRYACSLAWGLPLPQDLIDPHAWAATWFHLDPEHRTWLTYFTRWSTPLAPGPVGIELCHCPPDGS